MAKIKTPPPEYAIRFISGNVEVVGWLPEKLSQTSSSNWESPFENFSLAGALGEAMGAGADLLRYAGLGGGRVQAQTFKVWQGSSGLSLSLPIGFYASANAREEVVRQCVRLQAMTLPESQNGVMIPPGPSAVSFAAGMLSKIPLGGIGAQLLSGASKVGENVTVVIGKNFIRMTQVVIRDVSIDWDLRMSRDAGFSVPMAAVATVTIESFVTPTKGDLYRTMNLGD